ncbi:MAG: exosortase K [Clostridiaceae bacterium]
MDKVTFFKVKSFIKKYGMFYAIGFIIAFAFKYYYSIADADSLDWILAPTARWVQFLCGIPFEKEQYIGYVNHEYQFIIAPACAGMNFMIIAYSTLVCSFINRMTTVKSRWLWMVLCLVILYPYTILVNSLRIIPSIYLLRLDIYGGWITPERIHTIEGTSVYFASLLFLYFIVDEVLQHFATASGKNMRTVKSPIHVLYKYIIPVFLYFAVTLGVPFLNGAFTDNRIEFLEHAVIITVVCSIIILLMCLVLTAKKHFAEKVFSKS